MIKDPSFLVLEKLDPELKLLWEVSFVNFLYKLALERELTHQRRTYKIQPRGHLFQEIYWSFLCTYFIFIVLVCVCVCVCPSLGQAAAEGGGGG